MNTSGLMTWPSQSVAIGLKRLAKLPRWSAGVKPRRGAKWSGKTIDKILAR